MAKRSNRPLFLYGVGFQFLIYYCATGFKEIEVVNGKEKGSLLKEINAFIPLVKELENKYE